MKNWGKHDRIWLEKAVFYHDNAVAHSSAIAKYDNDNSKFLFMQPRFSPVQLFLVSDK